MPKFLGLISLILLFLPCVAGESHYETIWVTVMVSKQVCQTQSHESCYDCGWWCEHCNTVYTSNCYPVYETQNKEVKVCQNGWEGNDCSVPICTTPCTGGQVCANPNECKCLSTGAPPCTCVACPGPGLDCYPGTCISSSCTCPSGFSGPNCLNMSVTPVLENCMVKLKAGATESIVATADCALTGIEPMTTWTNATDRVKIATSWDSKYVNKISVPGREADTVTNAPVPLGVIVATTTVLYETNSGSLSRENRINDPQDVLQSNFDIPFSELGVQIQHNDTFTVTNAGELGGFKQIGATKISFIGSPALRSVRFKFDLEPPVHCLSIQSADCATYPIYLPGRDITTNQQINAIISNWTDDGSGLMKYHIEVYLMHADIDGQLVDSADPEKSEDIEPSRNNFVYMCVSSGVYSMHVTVFDQAGNYAKARKLFIYYGDAILKPVDGKPVYIREGNPNTNYTWITSIDHPANPNDPIWMTLVWTGHCSSNFDDLWGKAAKPRPSAYIDDNFGNKYGMRSIAPMNNLPNGIAAFEVAYTVDLSSGGSGQRPENWTVFNATQTSYVMNIKSLEDGNAIVVWFNCYGVAGNKMEEKIVTHVDTSPPQVQSHSFQKNLPDEFTSIVSIETYDRSGGIKQIAYSLIDATLKLTVHTEVIPPQMRDRPGAAVNMGAVPHEMRNGSLPSSKRTERAIVQPCTANDTDCYCIPRGECYSSIQQIVIDHCWIDRLAGDSFTVEFNVTNLASLTTTKQTIELGVLVDIPCRKNSLSTGEIAGIVIGSLIGLLLLIAAIIIIYLLCRVYMFKKPVPRVVQSMQKTIRQKFSSDPVTTDNELYEAGPNNVDHGKHNQYQSKPKDIQRGVTSPDDIYIFTATDEYIQEPDRMTGYWIPEEFLEKTKQFTLLSSGRMMTVSKAQLTTKNQEKVVALKALKNGSSSSSLKLMNSKIEFLSKLRPHVNIVKFIGAIQKIDGEGPVIVMEYCDMTLQNWLSDTSSNVTVDVLESMLSFILDIARGVSHLHANKIIHTRLGVRNVLLVNKLGSYVAKLIGFGPAKERENKNEKVPVPIKWLAPETLKTISRSNPTYNEKTDAWSYGITVWEIYSKGLKQPYPNLHADQAKLKIIAGEKMGRPDECPQELFDTVICPCWEMNSHRRPDFETICSRIEGYRSGSGRNPVGYYDSNETKDATYKYKTGQTNKSYADELYYVDAK